MQAISSMVISSRINRLLPQAMRPHYYFTVQHLAARARECQEAHGKSVAGFQRQVDEQRAAMADVQRKYGVWAAARPERAAAQGDHLCVSGQSRMRWVLLCRFT